MILDWKTKDKNRCVCVQMYAVSAYTRIFVKKKNELEDLLRWEHSLF